MNQNLFIITCGQGPEEAQRFVRLLTGRITALLAAESVTSSCRFLKSGRTAELCFEGPLPSALREEVGTHALVMLAHKARKKRSRWFAEVCLRTTQQAERGHQLDTPT